MNLNEAFENACSRFTGENFSTLSESDQILIAIWGLEADVNNGGFDQYYFNSSGNQAWFAPAALKKIGAHKMASIVDHANAIFDEAHPPVCREVRQAMLRRITNANEDAWDLLTRKFQAYPDDIATLLTKHLGLPS
ncbi:DMP19 family protein [Burkholderiaceae bacterium DAT-1]|nr:DMP19 family protein [Burkholderiaceae bacterium DAT-1]